jgi:AcrR family transcriptional regulator
VERVVASVPGRKSDTKERILDAALHLFATRGYENTSLDFLASSLGLSKQAVLYWFKSKDILLQAVIERDVTELISVLEAALSDAGEGWERMEAVVKSVFRIGVMRPELLELIREVNRVDSSASEMLVALLTPLMERASQFLQAEMVAGRFRKRDPRLVILATYSMVLGVLTDLKAMKALGEEPSVRLLVKWRQELLTFLRDALLIEADTGR